MFGLNGCPDWLGAIERIKATISEGEVNAIYADMISRGKYFLPQLGGDDITAEKWRDERIAEIRERDLRTNKSEDGK